MEKPPQNLETLSIRRASLVDSDKVRYRVYTTPSEFVAVIAESALMAVRASGIKAPYKIMRDMPAENGLVEPKKLEQKSDVAEQVMVALEARERIEQFITELETGNGQEPILFVPMGIAELQNKGMTRARILPAEMLNEIIEEHIKNTASTHEQPQLYETAPQPQSPEPATEPESDMLTREPELSPAERLTKLADETLPPPESRQLQEQPAEAPEEEGLSPEEVDKLLNG